MTPPPLAVYPPNTTPGPLLKISRGSLGGGDYFLDFLWKFDQKIVPAKEFKNQSKTGDVDSQRKAVSRNANFNQTKWANIKICQKSPTGLDAIWRYFFAIFYWLASCPKTAL